MDLQIEFRNVRQWTIDGLNADSTVGCTRFFALYVFKLL